jgi:hypothetical protein
MELANPDKPPDKKSHCKCCECGKKGEYKIDAFGIQTETWKCRECHEHACRRKTREDYWNRYGY